MSFTSPLLETLYKAVAREKRRHPYAGRQQHYSVSAAVAKKICSLADVQCPRLGYEVTLEHDSLGSYKGYWTLVNAAGKFHLRFRYTE